MTGLRCPHCRNWGDDHRIIHVIGLRVISCPKVGPDRMLIVPRAR